MNTLGLRATIEITTFMVGPSEAEIGTVLDVTMNDETDAVITSTRSADVQNTMTAVTIDDSTTEVCQ